MTEEQLLAQEIARAQAGNVSSGEVSTASLLEQLEKPFPKEAMTIDNSRGFSLTSIKPQYIVERLNHVLGLENWSHGGEYEVVNGGVIFKGALVATVAGKQVRQFAVGFGKDGKNAGDTYKSAKTDSLSKCASYLGIGNDVFKGLVTADSVKGSSASAKVSSAKKGKTTAGKTPTPAKVVTSKTETEESDDWGF